MDNIKKSKIIMKYFGIYGYGNFDISAKEFAKLLDMTKEKDIKNYYEKLEQKRLG